MATDALGNTIAVDQTYTVAGVCKVIDGDAITLVLGDKGEAKIRVKAGAIAKIADILAAGGILSSKWKQSVKVATTSNGTLSTSFENGDTIDGVVLTTGDRILLKHQSTPSQNGIYTVNASGAPTRATDANTGEQLVHAVVGVEQGTTNGDRFFVCFTNRPITIDVTAQAWTSLLAMLGSIDGSQLSDGTVGLQKLEGAGFAPGTLIQCDGSSYIDLTPGSKNCMLYFDGTLWAMIEPPGAKSVLTHDGGTDPPYWDPV